MLFRYYEPMLFHKKFPDIPVAVGEKRVEAIPQLLHDRPETQVIILDDAFQHRSIKAGFNIVLTDKENLYTRDFFLPTGDLRDLPSSAKRAEVIVVTKCPPEMEEDERREIITELALTEEQSLFFTSIQYKDPYHIIKGEQYLLKDETEVLLITGIANPAPLKKFLEERSGSYFMMHYPDHHIFTIDDWKDIRKRFTAMDSPDKILLTTEKDAMRFMKFGKEMNGMPFYVIPITIRFLFNQEAEFTGAVESFIQTFKRPE